MPNAAAIGMLVACPGLARGERVGERPLHSLARSIWSARQRDGEPSTGPARGEPWSHDIDLTLGITVAKKAALGIAVPAPPAVPTAGSTPAAEVQRDLARRRGPTPPNRDPRSISRMEGGNEMEVTRFDEWTRRVVTEPGSRRVVLRLLAGGTIGTLLARLGIEEAAAGCKNLGRRCKKKNGKKRKCCGGAECRGKTCKCPRGRDACGKRCCADGEACREARCLLARCVETLETADCALADGHWECPVGTDLQTADLSGCDLRNAVLPDVDLDTADLRGANLSGADLGDDGLATLNFADLTNADLTGANLLGAQMVGANLTGANLAGATVRDANLGSVVWSNTICGGGTNSNTYDPETCCCDLNTAPEGGCAPACPN